MKRKLNIDFKINYHVEKEIGGINRIIFSTPHSNARKKKTLDVILDEKSIAEIEERLKDAF